MQKLTLQDIQRLPKTDLHVHLDGSLRIPTILELAEQQKVKLPGDSVDALRPFVEVGEDCKSLVEYLRAFDVTLSVMQTYDALVRTAFELAEDAASFWHETGTNRTLELGRYHAVIHLQTPDLSHGYNHQNPLRIESATEAQALDARILEAWDGHPNRTIVESSSDFLRKATEAILAIKVSLPDCCREHPVLFGTPPIQQELSP